MAVFCILLFVPILIQHSRFGKHSLKPKKKNTIAITFFLLFLTLLVALRHESVGNDTLNYINILNRYSGMTWEQLRKETLEFGFWFLNKIISKISNDPQIYFAITAIITGAMIYPTYKRLCIDPSLTIVLYCTMSTFVMMFSGIRQMIAIGIGFIAYEFTRKKKIIPFVLMVILACSFHISAFMLTFMYPLYHVKITKKWLYFVVPALTITFVFNDDIFTSLTFIVERFTGYDGSITQNGSYAMLFLFIAFVAFSFIIPDEKLLDSETIGLRNFLLLSVVVQIFAPLHMLAMRMNYYYIIFIPLLIPKIIACRRKRFDQVAVLGRYVMVVFFLIYFFWNATFGSNLHVFPYHFFWESA